MFHSSTQRAYWIFKDLNELKELREKGNADFIKKQTVQNDYLTADEEKALALHYEYQIKQFCGKFQPPITMPSVVVSLKNNHQT
jgi:cyclin H